MKNTMVTVGLIIMALLTFFLYYISRSTNFHFFVKPETMQHTATHSIYLPIVQKFSPSLDETLKQKYLFVEHWITEDAGQACPGLVVEFPSYAFNPQNGELFIAVNPQLISTDMGYFGYGVTMTGAGNGINSSLSPISTLPQSMHDTKLHSVSAAGQLILTHHGQEISLFPEEVWISSPDIENKASGIPNCVITRTHRIINHGFQERSLITH
ncbi:MAG: hypothetical protein KDJ52_17700 [Anaerolineae bacterium]|nr:hypothetical protein [Anaerolineae bacterium]